MKNVFAFFLLGALLALPSGAGLYYLVMYTQPYLKERWLFFIALFLFVSIPMMEKHNAERRIDYAEYKEKTSMLLLLPNRK